MNLSKYKKGETSNDTYRKLFQKLKLKSRRFIFTDGSKQNEITNFTVVEEEGNILTKGTLKIFCFIFTAESVGILKMPGKSAIDAIRNISNSTNNTILTIRDLLIRFPNKLKITWTSGHCGISENEFGANQAVVTPSFFQLAIEEKDWLLFINSIIKNTYLTDWSNYSHP